MNSVSSPVAVPAADSAGPRRFSLLQRAELSLISSAGYAAMRLIAPTVRLFYSFEEGARPFEPQHPTIYVFWHRCIFMAAWCMRNQQGGIMVSRSFDGEYIARIAEKAGYVAVRGSSSRGGTAALREMLSLVKQGRSAAFTADGPRGPRYVAKPGPLLLARNTGTPIVAFHVALENPVVLRSWDRFMVPRPFSRGVIRGSRPLYVGRDADDDSLDRLQPELQTMLDRTRIAAEELLASGQYRQLPEHHWGRSTDRWVNPAGSKSRGAE